MREFSYLPLQAAALGICHCFHHKAIYISILKEHRRYLCKNFKKTKTKMIGYNTFVGYKQLQRLYKHLLGTGILHRSAQQYLGTIKEILEQIKELLL